jgi:5'-nucleotidase
MRGPHPTAPAPGSQPGGTIRWVFLDVGNVLLDEDPLSWLVFRRHAEAVRRVRPDRSRLDLLAERDARAAAGSRWPLFDVVSRYLDEARIAEVWAATDREVRGRFAALSPPVAGAVEAVERLSERFRLGLIANHPSPCRGPLAALGLLDRFEVVLLGEEQGLFKPDPALFLRALEWAGALPSEGLMVGDRLDQDIAPAAAVGLATAWVRWPDRSAKGWRPDDPEGRAYLRSLERTAALGEQVRPTITVDTIADLEAALPIRHGGGDRSSGGSPAPRPGGSRRPGIRRRRRR